MYDFLVNMSQENDIMQLKKRIQTLEKHLSVAQDWIKYLNMEIEKLKAKETK